MFLWTLGLHFSLSCRKVAAKFSNKVCSRSEFEEKSTNFQKQFFCKNHAPLDKWIAVLNILPKRFYQFSGIKFCINPKEHDFFKMIFFAVKIFLWRRRKFLSESGRKFFVRSPKKVLWLNLFSKQMFFLKRFPQHIMRSFGNSIEASCQISKGNRSKSVNIW